MLKEKTTGKNHLKDSINGRVKGSEYERQFCKWLLLNLGVKAKRNLDQVRDSGSDVLTEKFMFECKREEQLRLDDYWYQVIVSAKKFERETIPVVVFRQSRRKQEFLIPAVLIPGQKTGFVRIKEEVFLNFSKEMIANDVAYNNCLKKIYHS